VRDRNVGGLARLDGDRDADDFGGHVVEAGRLGVERHEIRLEDPAVPAIECLPAQYRLVVAGSLGRFLGRRGRVAVELPEQGPQFVAPVELAQPVRLAFAALELVDLHGQLDVAADRR
jgi:hypothetical protein